MISEFRLIGFLFNGCLVTNQPQSVLKMFLNFYTVIVVQVLPKNGPRCKISINQSIFFDFNDVYCIIEPIDEITGCLSL